MRCSKIDDALRQLHEATPPGVVLTRQQIADACGCDKALIEQFEKRALRRFRAKLREKVPDLFGAHAVRHAR
jgi:hypothetical protein